MDRPFFCSKKKAFDNIDCTSHHITQYLQLTISQEPVRASRQLTHPVEPLCTRNKFQPSSQI
eukprot:12816117-Ditylum_brightwellii.AAC.1